MGERGRLNEDATETDISQMASLVSKPEAGAVGFNTSRIVGHRSLWGEPVPGTFAPDHEVLAIAEAMKNLVKASSNDSCRNNRKDGKSWRGKVHSARRACAYGACLRG